MKDFNGLSFTRPKFNTYLENGGNEESGHHNYAEENQGCGPNVAQHEGHTRKLERSVLASSFSLPLSDHFANLDELSVHLSLSIFHLFVNLLEKTGVHGGEVRKGSSSDDGHYWTNPH